MKITGTWITFIETGFEAVGLLVLVIGTIIALARYGRSLSHRPRDARAFRALRESIGRSILLGLEFLVAADIIRSVAIDPTFASVGVLGLIVLVRTFLSWSLEVEITGVWPWQRAQLPNASHDSDDAIVP
ncbi:MAG TPA: DUF1622 domain-containing protein [Ktedonobacterales bacterium]|nr:DUF1622 domain-containing protein [Ktedonobacterales bacterium]